MTDGDDPFHGDQPAPSLARISHDVKRLRAQWTHPDECHRCMGLEIDRLVADVLQLGIACPDTAELERDDVAWMAGMLRGDGEYQRNQFAAFHRALEAIETALQQSDDESWNDALECLGSGGQQKLAEAMKASRNGLTHEEMLSVRGAFDDKDGLPSRKAAEMKRRRIEVDWEHQRPKVRWSIVKFKGRPARYKAVKKN